MSVKIMQLVRFLSTDLWTDLHPDNTTCIPSTFMGQRKKIHDGCCLRLYNLTCLTFDMSAARNLDATATGLSVLETFLRLLVTISSSSMLACLPVSLPSACCNTTWKTSEHVCEIS